MLRQPVCIRDKAGNRWRSTPIRRRKSVPAFQSLLNAQPQDAQLFTRLLGAAVRITQARSPGERPAVVAGSLPRAEILAVLALAALLGGYALWGAQLTWGRTT